MILGPVSFATTTQILKKKLTKSNFGPQSCGLPSPKWLRLKTTWSMRWKNRTTRTTWKPKKARAVLWPRMTASGTHSKGLASSTTFPSRQNVPVVPGVVLLVGGVPAAAEGVPAEVGGGDPNQGHGKTVHGKRGDLAMPAVVGKGEDVKNRGVKGIVAAIVLPTVAGEARRLPKGTGEVAESASERPRSLKTDLVNVRRPLLQPSPNQDEGVDRVVSVNQKNQQQPEKVRSSVADGPADHPESHAPNRFPRRTSWRMMTNSDRICSIIRVPRRLVRAASPIMTTSRLTTIWMMS